MKKLTLYLLLSALLTGSLAACSEKIVPSDDTAAAETSAEEESNGRENVRDSLPDSMDYDGTTIRVLTRAGDNETSMMLATRPPSA